MKQLCLLVETIFSLGEIVSEEKEFAPKIDLNDLNLMLLLITFDKFKLRFVTSEYRKRIGSLLKATIKPHIYQDCPDLFINLCSLFDFLFKSDSCLEVIMPDILNVAPYFIPELTRGKFLSHESNINLQKLGIPPSKADQMAK
jgi:hypothetical protein